MQPPKKKILQPLAGTLGIVFSMLACQPVFVIGWREFVVVFILVALLIGPLVYRFIRRVEKSLKEKGKAENEEDSEEVPGPNW